MISVVRLMETGIGTMVAQQGRQAELQRQMMNRQQQQAVRQMTAGERLQNQMMTGQQSQMRQAGQHQTHLGMQQQRRIMQRQTQ